MKNFTPTNQAEYDAAFEEGCDDAVVDDVHNPFEKGTPAWQGYQDGAHAVMREDRELPDEVPDELESIPNCDDWGTEEGRYHGRI